MTRDENDDDVSLWDVDLKCRECGWTGISKNTDFATNEDRTMLMVCPRCKTVDNFEVQNEEKTTTKD